MTSLSIFFHIHVMHATHYIKIVWIFRGLSTPLRTSIYPNPNLLQLDAGGFLSIMSNRMTKKGPVSKLKSELEAKEAELAEIKALMLRKAAEYDNSRKRWQREREELKPAVTAEILADFCDVWDNFERALHAHEVNGDGFEAYRKGVELIFNQFTEKLSKFGLKQYSCLGEDFDPSRAEAIGHVDSKGVRHGTVVEELKRGFMLGERVLRPAQVIVARQEKVKKDGPGVSSEHNEESGESEESDYSDGSGDFEHIKED